MCDENQFLKSSEVINAIFTAVNQYGWAGNLVCEEANSLKVCSSLFFLLICFSIYIYIIYFCTYEIVYSGYTHTLTHREKEKYALQQSILGSGPTSWDKNKSIFKIFGTCLRHMGINNYRISSLKINTCITPRHHPRVLALFQCIDQQMSY